MSLYSLNLKLSGLISTVNKTIQKYSALELVPFSTKVYETTSIANNLIFDCGNVQKRNFTVNLIENISSIKFINFVPNGEYIVFIRPLSQKIIIMKNCCLNNLLGDSVFEQVTLARVLWSPFGMLVQFDVFSS